MVQLNFNSQQYQPKYDTAGGLPPGKGYIGMITQTSGEETIDKQGGFLALTITVLDGPLKDQTQVDRLNIHNKSPIAVKIANEQLSAYCHVTGVFVLQESDQLCGKPFKFDISPQRKNPDYTEVSAIYDINGNKPGQANGQTQQNNNPPPQNPPPPPPNAGNSGWQAGGDNSGQGNGGGTTWTPPGQAGGPAPQEGPSQGGGGWSGNPNPGPAPGAGGGWNPQGGGAGGAGSGGGWAGR